MNAQDMGLNEWLLIGGALVGPVLAVQAQKVVEALSEGKQLRERVFHTLMGTRQTRLSSEHVGALNSIDLAFYEVGVGPFKRQPSRFKAVRSAWADYRAGLTRRPGEARDDPQEDAAFQARAEELFVNLMEKMAAALGYRFDRNELQTSSYSPEAHGYLEQQQAALRVGLLSVLAGQRAISMDVKTFPQDAELTERAIAAQEALAKSLADFARVIAQQNGASQPARLSPSQHNASMAMARAQDRLKDSKDAKEDSSHPDVIRNPPKK